MLSVLFLNPPFLPRFSRPQRSPAVTKSATLYYPLFLAQAAAVAAADGFAVDVCDAPADGLDLAAVTARAQTRRPALAVLDTSTPSIDADIAAAAALRAAVPGLFTVLVGPHASALPGEVLSAVPGAVCAVARREYDLTVLELARVLDSGPATPARLATIDGLSFRDGQGRLRHNPDRPYLDDLGRLPPVAPIYKQFLNIDEYFNPNAKPPMVTLATSRGCPYRCSFCLHPQTLTGRTARYRPIEAVLDEVAWCLDHFPGLRTVFFEDDTLTADRARCREFCAAIVRRGLVFDWTANSRADLPAALLAAMAKAGCRQVCVGFESADETALSAMKKGLSPARMERFRAEAKAVGIRVHGCFLFGLPGDTRASILRTIDFAVKLNPDTAQFYPVMVYPGTEAYEDYRQRGFIEAAAWRDWLTPAGLHTCVVRNETLSPAELVRLCDLARRRFYLRPSFLARRALAAAVSPGELARTTRAAKVFVRHLLAGSGV
ncbi:MAG: radical SAM protein [Solidesulfovibrio sp.]|uniref:B12-binding domain-containing radical SAM protein n=1 Tax=Solidesulfovibrio sp. TaxID=2910990 RepID=UPI002B20DC9C|nr:radical SAM protein [Solidesulfovibrio sp.]MEA4855676.1 radical SAM protein [Solidesulfovibrio sp.]